jgi:hypothetical protein
MVVKMSILVLWAVTPCRLYGRYHFGGMYGVTTQKTQCQQCKVPDELLLLKECNELKPATQNTVFKVILLMVKQNKHCYTSDLSLHFERIYQNCVYKMLFS